MLCSGGFVHLIKLLLGTKSNETLQNKASFYWLRVLCGVEEENKW